MARPSARRRPVRMTVSAALAAAVVAALAAPAARFGMGRPVS